MRSSPTRLASAAALATVLCLGQTADAFDLTGTWEVKRGTFKCTGFGSDTSEPEMSKLREKMSATDVEITQTGGDLNMVFDRASSFFMNELMNGYAFDVKKSNGIVDPKKSVGAFVSCGGIPDNLQGTTLRTELGTIQKAKRNNSGKASMQLEVLYVRFGFESGGSAFTNLFMSCVYKLKRISDIDPLVPPCP